MYFLNNFFKSHTHTQPFYCSSGICPGPPGWADTRKVKPGRLKPIWIYWSKRQWVAVASARLKCKSAPHPRQPLQHPTTQFFLQAGCPSCHPTNSVKALKEYHIILTKNYGINKKLQNNLGTAMLPPLMAENNYATKSYHWLQWDAHIYLQNCPFPFNDLHPI